MILNYLGAFDNLTTNPRENQARILNKHNAAVCTICVLGAAVLCGWWELIKSASLTCPEITVLHASHCFSFCQKIQNLLSEYTAMEDENFVHGHTQAILTAKSHQFNNTLSQYELESRFFSIQHRTSGLASQYASFNAQSSP